MTFDRMKSITFWTVIGVLVAGGAMLLPAVVQAVIDISAVTR